MSRFAGKWTTAGFFKIVRSVLFEIGMMRFLRNDRLSSDEKELGARRRSSVAPWCFLSSFDEPDRDVP